MGTVNIPTLFNSNAISPDSTVLINLSNNEAGSRRIIVNEHLTLGELGVDFSSQAAQPPTWSEVRAKMAEVTSRTDIDDEEKHELCNALLADHKAKVAAFANAGGLNDQDKIAFAVCDWLIANKGFSSSDTGADSKIVRPSDLQVSAVPQANGLTIFSVTGTSVWG